jgi:hypothetical protein
MTFQVLFKNIFFHVCHQHQDLFNYNQSQYEAPPSWDACDTFKDLDDLGFLTELNNNGYDPILDFSMPQSVDRKPTILQGQHWSHDPLDMSSKVTNYVTTLTLVHLLSFFLL